LDRGLIDRHSACFLKLPGGVMTSTGAVLVRAVIFAPRCAEHDHGVELLIRQHWQRHLRTRSAQQNCQAGQEIRRGRLKRIFGKGPQGKLWFPRASHVPKLLTSMHQPLGAFRNMPRPDWLLPLQQRCTLGQQLWRLQVDFQCASGFNRDPDQKARLFSMQTRSSWLMQQHPCPADWQLTPHSASR